MSEAIDKKTRQKIRKRRGGISKGTKERPRIVFSESNRYLRVQAIDDTIGHTLLAFSTADFTAEDIEKL